MSCVEQAIPGLVYVVYDGPNEIFVDPLTGMSLDRDAAGSRLARLIAGAETPGAFDPVRFGIRTMSRYSAEKAALAGVLGRADGESDNRKPNLVPAAYSRATRPKLKFNEEVEKYVTGDWPTEAADRYRILQEFGNTWATFYRPGEGVRLTPFRGAFS